MDISIFLAKAMGIYFIIISLAVFINRQRFINIVKSLIQNEALLLTMYINILIVGILLVLSHNVWEISWRVVITIVAWLVLLKAVLNIAFPQFSIKLAQPFLRSANMLYFSILINLLIGIYLCYYGFFANNL